MTSYCDCYSNILDGQATSPNIFTDISITMRDEQATDLQKRHLFWYTGSRYIFGETILFWGSVSMRLSWADLSGPYGTLSEGSVWVYLITIMSGNLSLSKGRLERPPIRSHNMPALRYISWFRGGLLHANKRTSRFPHCGNPVGIIASRGQQCTRASRQAESRSS